ncbi:MAG: hypothetical protein ROY99_03585 [Ignavibacterium sp.]|nr:hypothetical protein [Ignavibacterium sp.]
MKIIIKMILLITLISTISYGQNMWLRGKIDLGSLHMMSNLSVDSIKQIIVTVDLESQNLLYPASVKYLYYIQSDAEFLLDNLNSEIDTSLSVSENSAYWYKVYTNIFFRGLLGDNMAVEKMKIIANHATYLTRLLAIRTLAEIGIYDNYSFVIAGYNDSPELFINLLAWYGNDSRYKEEVKSIIMNKIVSSSTTSQVIMLAYDLNIFSNEGTILLDTYFENNLGEQRYDYFFELGIIDKDGQPERSIFALQNENNDTLRAKYLPNPFEVLNYGFESKRYIEPSFINLLKQLSISDTNSLTYRSKKQFLLLFVPAQPDSLKPTIDLLDNLNNYVDSVFNYTWLGDLTFSNELKNILTTAKTNLQNGDSLACRVQVKAFQDLVDNVYKDSLNTDPRFVTIEGWKFLYWNAQYILDRLPKP